MIINYFGIQLQIIDLGGGNFEIRPIDAVADKQIVRDELARLRADRLVVLDQIDASATERDFHVERRDFFVAKRLEHVAERDAINVTIADLKLFLESAGDVDA